MIITVFGRDNCVEKSMIAIHLAALRARDHHAVLLIDADPQKHAFLWSLRHGASEAARLRVPVLPLVDVSLQAELTQLHGCCKDIVIDAGVMDEANLRTALIVSRGIIVLARMPPVDMRALTAALEQAERVHPGERMIIVVGQPCDEDAQASAVVAARLHAALPCARLVRAAIQDHAAIAATFQQGLTIFEIAPVDDSAKDDIEGLAAAMYGGVESASGKDREIAGEMPAPTR